MSNYRKLEIFDKLVALVDNLCVTNNIRYFDEVELCKTCLEVSDDELIIMGIRDIEFERDMKEVIKWVIEILCIY